MGDRLLFSWRSHGVAPSADTGRRLLLQQPLLAYVSLASGTYQIDGEGK